MDQGSPDNLVFEHPVSCADGDGLRGYMNSFTTNIRRAWIVVCPDMFARNPLVLDDVECNTLGDVASFSMVTIGATILHELMHWEQFTRAHVGFDIMDWNSQRKPNVDPPTGYGP